MAVFKLRLTGERISLICKAVNRGLSLQLLLGSALLLRGAAVGV